MNHTDLPDQAGLSTAPTKPYRYRHRKSTENLLMSKISQISQWLISARNTKNDLAATSANLLRANNELLDAEQALARAQLGYGERVLSAKDPDDLVLADAELASQVRHVERLRAARNALAAREAELKAKEDHRSLEQRWDEAEALLRKRDELIAKANRAAQALARAMVEAQDAAVQAYEAMPVRSLYGAPLSPEFAHLDKEIQVQLSVYSDGAAGSLDGSRLWEYRRSAQFLDRVAASTAHWLSVRPDGLADHSPEAA